MTQDDIQNKQIILINYLQNLIDDFTSSTDWKVKAEYSTNDNDKRVIVVQEQAGSKEVFFGDCVPLYNYFSITIYGLSIQECKNISLVIGNLIGQSILVDNKRTKEIEKWQLIFKQFTNPQTIEYLDIRRIGYNATLQCIVNKVSTTLLETEE